MEQEITLRDIHGDHSKKEIHNIYYKSFDSLERFSYEFLYESSYRNDVKMFSVHEGSAVVGFCYIIIGEAVIYLEYLAISDKYRDHGFGTKIISLIKSSFPGKAIIIDMEDEAHDPEGYRKRCRFYTANGFYATPYKVCYDDKSAEELWITDPSINISTELMTELLKKQFKPDDLTATKEHLPIVFKKQNCE